MAVSRLRPERSAEARQEVTLVVEPQPSLLGFAAAGSFIRMATDVGKLTAYAALDGPNPQIVSPGVCVVA
jgi:hypothetical protein